MRYYAICGDVTNREINESKLQSACWSASGNCWSTDQVADCMRDFFYGREDDEIYQYCPEGENNVLITSNGSDVFIASQNPDGNTAIEDQMSYQCVAYCTGGSGDSSESGNLAPIISNSSLPEPLRTDVYNFEDPNRTCTWNMYYTV